MNSFSESMNSLLRDFYRCPKLSAAFTLEPELSAAAGYFRVGKELICYGRLAQGRPAAEPGATLEEAKVQVGKASETCSLPFDPAEAVANLRQEKYAAHGFTSGRNGRSLVRKIYYLLRPLMPVGVRKHMQRHALRGWAGIPFPRWPVDRTVDLLHEWMLGLALQASGASEIPFVWFWPDGHSAGALITHDVETAAGRDFCPALMDLNDEFQIKSSFQVIPEERYAVSESFLAAIRSRGFEINVHDLNHDGHLFSDWPAYLRRVKRINEYGRIFGARGFRSAVLYRNQEWLSELQFDYDMSVPSVAHLEPQRGGCCTLMPYFLGNLLEMPVTTTQDYPLFHILRDYSTKLWEEQVRAILQAHGMASFIIHPDYVIERRARETYRQLLAYLADLRAKQGLWIARPGEVNDWWRARAQMQLVQRGSAWRIEGPQSDRARVAYARSEDGGIVYRVEGSKVGAWAGAGKQ